MGIRASPSGQEYTPMRQCSSRDSAGHRLGVKRLGLSSRNLGKRWRLEEKVQKAVTMTRVTCSPKTGPAPEPVQTGSSAKGRVSDRLPDKGLAKTGCYA